MIVQKQNKQKQNSNNFATTIQLVMDIKLAQILDNIFPKDIVLQIQFYAAQCQPAALCQDIISFACTMDRMFEGVLYLRIFDRDRFFRDYFARLNEQPDLKLREWCPNISNRFPPSLVAAELFYREEKFDIYAKVLEDVFVDFSKRCAYAKKFSDELEGPSQRHLILFIGLLTVDERTKFAEQYLIETNTRL